MIYNQMVTWTAFAILAMFIFIVEYKGASLALIFPFLVSGRMYESKFEEAEAEN